MAGQRAPLGAVHHRVDVAVDEQLSVLALPAASVPPTSVATHEPQRPGDRAAASTITGTVVTSSSSMIRGLVSAT